MLFEPVPVHSERGVEVGLPVGELPYDAVGAGVGRLAQGQKRVKLPLPAAPHVENGPDGFQHTICVPAVVEEKVYPGSAAPATAIVSLLISVPQTTPANAAIALSSTSLGWVSNAESKQPPSDSHAVSQESPGALTTHSAAAVISHVEGEGVEVTDADTGMVPEGEGVRVTTGVTDPVAVCEGVSAPVGVCEGVPASVGRELGVGENVHRP